MEIWLVLKISTKLTAQRTAKYKTKSLMILKGNANIEIDNNLIIS